MCHDPVAASTGMVSKNVRRMRCGGRVGALRVETAAAVPPPFARHAGSGFGPVHRSPGAFT